MKPEITFQYSRIYNTVLSSHLEPDILKQLPDSKKMLAVKQNIEKYWEENGENVLSSICKISGLEWTTTNIPIYLTSYSRSFSSPLTISISKKKNGNIQLKDESSLQITLVHELIHTILVDNKEKQNELNTWIEERYANEKHLVKVHIKVHAIEYGVLLELGMKKEIDEFVSNIPEGDYKKAWGIVNDEGYVNILNRIENKQ